MRITVWDLSRKVNYLSKVIWDRKIRAKFTRSISSTRIGKPVLMMDVKVSKYKNISRWVDCKNLILVFQDRDIARINWIIQVCLTQSKNVRRVWFKERFVKFKRRPQIFIKLSFRELRNSKLSGLRAFDNMAIIP